MFVCVHPHKGHPPVNESLWKKPSLNGVLTRVLVSISKSHLLEPLCSYKRGSKFLRDVFSIYVGKKITELEGMESEE